MVAKYGRLKPDGTEGRWRWKKENVSENELALEFVKKDSHWEIYVKQYIDENQPGHLVHLVARRCRPQS